MSHVNLSSLPKLCVVCTDEIEPPARAQIRNTCLLCGEEAARVERLSWCVVQEYGKGPYQFITASAAPTTLRQTNQKQTRI